MIRSLVVLLIATASFRAPAQNRIVAQVTNFDSNKGSCITCLFDNAKAFSGKGKPVQCLTTPVANKTTLATFDNVPEGSYAILVIHDANNNKKIDTNFLGIPTEGYGASNNRLPLTSAPKFEESKFTVHMNTTTNCTIRLRYVF